MYYINKIVWFVLNPVMVALLALIASVVFLRLRRLRGAGVLLILSIVWLWLWGTSLMTVALGLPLEKPYLATQSVAALPQADAIVALGGGMGHAEGMEYPEMFPAADRIWHAARLYKAGKAPRVILSGNNSESSTVPLLLDFGVPREAILVDNTSRNTYENARFTEKLLPKGAKILLVTSAWHMTRARGNFAKTSLQIVPAASDFECSYAKRGEGESHFWDYLVPNADSLSMNVKVAKEWLGRLARR